jgi:hypothetical protein
MVPLCWTQCTPAAKSWDSRVVGKCPGQVVYERYAYFWGSMFHDSLQCYSKLFADRSVGFEAIVDCALAIYPAVIFYKLNMRLPVKIGLTVLFSIGILYAFSLLDTRGKLTDSKKRCGYLCSKGLLHLCDH